MQPNELLPTLVEFSVAVAGFTGVVAALSPLRPSDWSLIQRGLFSALLVSTAISAGLAILAMALLAVAGLVLIQAFNVALLQTGWLCVAALSAYAFLSLVYFVILVRQLWGDSPST